MSLLGGIAEGVSTVASVGTKIVSTVTSLGAKAIGGVGKLFKSKIGVLALGSLGGILLTNNIGKSDELKAAAKANEGESNGFQGFMSAAKDTISGVIGGAASLFRGLTEKVTTAAKNLFGRKDKDKDNDLDNAVNDASRENSLTNMLADIGEKVSNNIENAKAAEAKSTGKEDAGEEYGA